MKAIRYIIFFQFLLVLGLLAVVYAAPDTLLLTVSAAENTEAECGAGECLAATVDPSALADQVVSRPTMGDGLAGETALSQPDRDGAASEIRLQAAGQDLEVLQIEADSLRDRHLAIPAGNTVDPVANLEAPDGVVEVTRYDPGLMDEASALSLDLQEELRIDTELGAFVRQVNTGHAGVVRGVFVADTLSMPVRRQPAGYPGFISAEEGVVTQFGMAESYGSIGLLAHNHLAGSQFFGLEEGQQVYVVYGDGEIRRFTVAEIHRYRAGQPNSPYSDFYDLDNGEAKYSAKEVFHMMYNREGDLVFQTCIDAEGINTWGRLFIIASPV